VFLVPLVIAMFVAGTISGITGFGVGVVGSISLAVLVGPKTAVVLLSIVSSFSATTQVLKYRAHLPEVRRLTWLLAGGFFGAAGGSFLLVVLPYSALAILLGLFTLSYVAASLIGFRPVVSPGAERALSPAVGLVAGLVNSSVGSSGPVLGPYLLALGIPPQFFVISLSAAFLVMGTVRIVSLAALQQFNLPIVAAGVGLFVPTVAGQFAGFWLASRVPKHVFERLILGLLAIAATYLIVRGFQALSG
jgi:uncharacterized protein